MTTATISEALSFERISKSYKQPSGTLSVLSDCSFAVPDERFVSVLGPSGCGKSTLLSMAAGFTEPDTGRVVANGSTVSEPHSAHGVVFQQYAIFPWLTVRKNIEFGLTLRTRPTPRQERQEITDRYVELVGLKGFEDFYPKDLSGGMRQRVAIARAYAPNPRILLMDEPFAALDAQTRELMQELLAGIQQQERKTVMFITHGVEEAIFLSHRVVVLSSRPGQVREVIDIPMPLPRGPETRLSAEFVDLRRHLEHLLRHEPGGDA